MNNHFVRFAILGLSFAVMFVDRGDCQTPPEKNAPGEERVTLSTLDDNEAVIRRIEDHQFVIDIKFTRSMLGTKKLNLKIESDEPGQWSDSSVTSGTTLQVKRTGNQEPRGCVVESVHAVDEDPAAKYEQQVIDRVADENGVVTATAAKNEIARLADEFGRHRGHVLKLPRWAGSRLDPEDTLRRLCRWIAYDNLFQQLKLDMRPTATDAEAKKTYNQALAVLRGDPLQQGESEHRLSDEEIERIREAYQFEYAVRFIPALLPDEADQNWLRAKRVSFVNNHVGRVRWQGELGQGHQSTTWLAVRTTSPESNLDISAIKKSANLSHHWVEGPDGWRYLRLRNTSKKQRTPFQLRITADNNAPEIQISHHQPHTLQFPF